MPAPTNMTQAIAKLQCRFIEHGMWDEAALRAARELFEEVVTKQKTPPFYVTRTLLGFSPGPDLNRVFLNLPDGAQFVLREMNEPRTEQDSRRWQALAERLSILWMRARTAAGGG